MMVASLAMQRLRRAAVIVSSVVALSACRRNHEPRLGEVVPLVPQTSSPVRSSNSQSPSQNPTEIHSTVRDSGVAFSRWVENRTPPTGGLGVTFGTTREALHSRLSDSGVTCRDADPYVFCPRVPDAGPASIVTYEFCNNRLCTIALDGTRTTVPTEMLREFDALVAMVQRELGPPPTRIRYLAPGCSSQAVCLHAGQSRLLARWAWHNGPEVSVMVDQVEDDQFIAQAAVTYISADRVRQGIPDPGPPPVVDAGVTQDSSTEDLSQR